MSFNSASFGPPNGYHSQRNTPRAFAEANGNHARQYSQGQGQQPQIYTVRIYRSDACRAQTGHQLTNSVCRLCTQV